jgi:hypothetical protein
MVCPAFLLKFVKYDTVRAIFHELSTIFQDKTLI